MTLFKSTSFYVAILGIIMASFLVHQLMKPQPLPTPYVQPAVNPYENTVAASGIVEAVDRNVSMGVPISGLVTEIFVDVGQKVDKGIVLFTLDNRDLEATLDVDKANIEVAKAKLMRLKDQLYRLQSVSDPRAVSADEVKTRANDVLVAQTELQAAQAKVQETLRLIDRLKVQAPKDGTILQKNIRVGEYISASSNTPAIVIGNLDQLQIRADIDEQNAAAYIPGAKAVAFPRNNTTLSIPLTFSYIEPYVIPKRSLTGSSEERVDTRVLQVIYTFEKPQKFPIYVGQQVDVFIELPVEE